MKILNRNSFFLVVVFLVGLFLGGGGFYSYQSFVKTKEVLPPQGAAQKAIDFINDQLLRGETTASLLNVEEENGLYKLKLKIRGQEIDAYITKNGKLLFPNAIDLEKKPRFQPRVKKKNQTIGDFNISTDKVCKEEEGPIVYFFGSQGCPHCRWEHPIFKKVAEKFKNYISFHDNMGTKTDREVFQKYSTGGVPTLVLGCKYFRIGSGERMGKEKESKILTALICKLTENQPFETCEEVSDLIDKIEQ